MVLFKHPGLWELCVHTLGKASCASWISGNSFILSIIRCFFQLFVRFPTWRRLRWNVLCLVSSVFPWRFHRSVLEQSSKEQVCPAVTDGNCATALLASVPSGRLWKWDGSVWKEGSQHWQEAPRTALLKQREVTGSGDAFQSCISMLCAPTFFIQPAACPDSCVKKEGRCLLQILRHQTCIFSTSQYSLEKKWAVWHVCRGAEGKQRSRSRKHPATSECQGCAMPREWMIPGQGTTKRYVLVGKAVRCSLAELDFICLCPLHFLNDAGQITSHRSFHLRYHALC